MREIHCQKRKIRANAFKVITSKAIVDNRSTTNHIREQLRQIDETIPSEFVPIEASTLIFILE